MPDQNPIAGLYPAPPQPAQNALSNPWQAIQGISSLQSNQRAQQLFNAQRAGGAAFANALSPDGSIDPAKITSALQDPSLGLVAPQLAGDALTQRNQFTELGQRQLNLAIGQNDYATRVVGSLVSNPNLKPDDVNQVKPLLARAGIPPTMLGAMPTDPAALRKWAANFNTVASGTQGQQPIAAPPGPGYTPQQQPLVTAGYGSPVRATSPPLGAGEAANVTAQGGAQQGITLGTAADSSPTRKAMLGNLETDLQNFTAGPGADWTKVAKAWANRNVLPTPLQFDPTSIASQEQFTKQAEQLAQQQFAAIGGTGTDAKFGSAFKSNPNDALSQLGNTGIIRLLKGNEDAIQAKNSAWQDWLAKGNSPATYSQFAQQFNQSFDPRVYQSQYMSKPDFTKMLKSMSAPEARAFVQKFNSAKTAGYVTDPGAQYNGQ